MEPLNLAIIRIRLAEISSRILVIFIAVALVTCPLLVPQPLLVIQTAFVDLLLALIVWFLIHKHVVTRFSPHLVIATCFITVTPLAIMCGGVNSHFMYLYPISPLMAGLLINNRGAWIVAAILIVQIFLLTLADQYLPAYSGNINTWDETLLRAYWLVAATLLTAVFVSFYERLNNRFRKEMSELAFKDVLTQIPSRRSLMEALEISIAYSRENDAWLTIMMIDVDQFKQVNDTHNHTIGDLCLKWIANRLQSSLRSNSDLVARIGGDEFVAMLPDVDEVQAARISELVTANIAANGEIDGTSLPDLSVSIGCASARGKDLPSAKEMLIRADTAMYWLKSVKSDQIPA